MSKIYSSLLRNIVLPFGDLIFGQQMISRLKFLEVAQYWPYEKLIEKQNEYLRDLISVAYTEVPFYHSIMSEKGINPEDISTARDLQKLPIVTKDMLRKAYPHDCIRPTGQKTYESCTSGSTGKNFIVREDAQTAGWYRATFLLQQEWTGWSIGKPHLQTGMNLKRSLNRKIKDLALGCHYVDAHRLEDIYLDKMLETLDRYDLKFLWGYPGSLYYLSKYAGSKGWAKPLKAVSSWGSSLYPHYRSAIEEVFRCKVFDQYGCGEGIQVSAQCEFGNYHLNILDAAVEFLDDNGQPVLPGQIGNIVVTRLHPGPMPLIRYSIGDMGVPSDDVVCRCGRTFPLMQSIKGRSGDVVITPKGNRLLSEYFCGILEYFPEVDKFQVIQEAADSVKLNLVPVTVLSEEKIQEIIKVLTERGAPDLKFIVNLVSDIPLPSTGKHRYIINNLQKIEN